MAHRSLIKLAATVAVLGLMVLAPGLVRLGLGGQARADGGPLVYQLDFSCSVNQVGTGLMQVSSDAANTGTVTVAVEYYPDSTTRTGGVDTGTPHLTVTLTGAGNYSNLAFPRTIPSQYLTGTYYLRVTVIAVTGTVSTASIGVNGDLLQNCTAPPPPPAPLVVQLSFNCTNSNVPSTAGLKYITGSDSQRSTGIGPFEGLGHGLIEVSDEGEDPLAEILDRTEASSSEEPAHEN